MATEYEAQLAESDAEVMGVLTAPLALWETPARLADPAADVQIEAG